MGYLGDGVVKRTLKKLILSAGYRVVRARSYDTPTDPIVADGDRKVFCLGFNKTATTTLEAYLRQHGYRMPKQIEQEMILSAASSDRDLTRVRSFLKDFDAFQDLPFSQGNFYQICDLLFPKSKFILSYRDPEIWVESYLRFYRDVFGMEDTHVPVKADFEGQNLYLRENYVYEILRDFLMEPRDGQPVVRWDLAFDRVFLIAQFQKRNAEIRHFFAGRNEAFLELDVTAETDTKRLDDFLGITGAATPFPHKNATHRPVNIKDNHSLTSFLKS